MSNLVLEIAVISVTIGNQTFYVTGRGILQYSENAGYAEYSFSLACIATASQSARKLAIAARRCTESVRIMGHFACDVIRLDLIKPILSGINENGLLWYAQGQPGEHLLTLHYIYVDKT